jgi:hypothetical protein
MRLIAEGIDRVARVVAQNPDDHDAKQALRFLRNDFKVWERQVPRGWNWRERLGWEAAWAKYFHTRMAEGMVPVSIVGWGLAN